VAPAPSRTRSSAAALAAYFAPAMLVTKHGAFSGIGEALTTILISEIGDKTFFLTMILAMRRGRILALSSALSALWVMTGLSASIGVMLRSLPSNLIREAWVRLAAGLLMIFFGIQSFRERESKLEVGPECKGAQDEAECEIESQLSRSKSQSFVIDWFRFSVLIFLAEWGDRSMFATVTLAATRSPIGVVLGGCMGHTVAALLAVLSGGLLEKYVSDKAVKVIGGVLFISFGVTTLLGIY